MSLKKYYQNKNYGGLFCNALLKTLYILVWRDRWLYKSIRHTVGSLMGVTISILSVLWLGLITLTYMMFTNGW